MKEILITSSVLIVLLIVLRRMFRSSLPRRMQYALWGLVLLRLLAPVSLPAVDFSVLTAARPVQAAVSDQLETPVYLRPQAQIPASAAKIPVSQVPTAGEGRDMVVWEENGANPAGYLIREPESQSVTLYAVKMGTGEILALIWKIGMAGMGVFFLASNLRFWRRLQKYRTPYAVKGCRRPTYLVGEGVLPSPCLFGLFRPAIYLTPAALSSEERLRHVLEHEQTHARHLDPLWSLLRCICLTVYWFDPLVWVSAYASKIDCELACDEGVLARLGEQERIRYGQTLLSLVQVGGGPSNPLLSATTMTTGKRQMKDRITRLVRRPKRLAAGTLAVVLLAGIVSACTFTGGAREEPEGLTAEELGSFNQAYFNEEGDGCFRNRFLTSLYEGPEEIDLFQLFYCGGNGPAEMWTAEEKQAVIDNGYDGVEPDCGLTKISAASMDAVLTQFMGLTLEQTAGKGLDSFTYLPDYDAYYHFHGDTNYPGAAAFLQGERQGKTVKLYYGTEAGGGGDSWYCMTLEEQDGGGYHVRSHVPAERPASTLVLPRGEPEKVLSLADVQPYTPEAYTVEIIHEWKEQDELYQAYGDYELHLLTSYQNSTQTFAVVNPYKDREEYRVFLTLPLASGNSGTEGFVVGGGWDDGLFGWDGHVDAIDYWQDGELVCDYLYIDPDGTPVRILQARGSGTETFHRDFSGDGAAEVVSPTQLFFQREGEVYAADLPALWGEAYPAVSYDHGRWENDNGRLAVTGYGGPQIARYQRFLYFDGESLLVYQDSRGTTDHVMEGCSAPQTVIDKAKELVRERMPQRGDEIGRTGRGTPILDEAEYDDWRLESVTELPAVQVGGISLRVYRINCEYHTTTPGNVLLMGGMYLTEDGWVSPGYPDCDYLFFRAEEDGGLTFLWSEMSNDLGPEFLAEPGLERLGLLQADAQYQIGTRFDHLMNQDTVTLELTPGGGTGGGPYTFPGNFGNAPRGLIQDYSWGWVEESQVSIPQGSSSLTLGRGADRLVFWDHAGLVECQANGNTDWFQAQLQEETNDGFYATPFAALRRWYDEAEMDALRSAIAPIPEDGRSHEEIARAWVEQYEGLHCKVTPGSKCFCTYLSISDVEEDHDAAQESDGVFLFWYNTIFVPENKDGLNWMMAGNTEEYTGDDPDVPPGAFRYGRCGYMYRSDGGWRCDGVGTGP